VMLISSSSAPPHPVGSACTNYDASPILPAKREAQQPFRKFMISNHKEEI
jgi:hypothetical protein